MTSSIIQEDVDGGWSSPVSAPIARSAHPLSTMKPSQRLPLASGGPSGLPSNNFRTATEASGPRPASPSCTSTSIISSSSVRPSSQATSAHNTSSIRSEIRGSHDSAPGWQHSSSSRSPFYSTGSNRVLLRPRSFAVSTAGALTEGGPRGVREPQHHIRPQQVRSEIARPPAPHTAQQQRIAPHLLLLQSPPKPPNSIAPIQNPSTLRPDRSRDAPAPVAPRPPVRAALTAYPSPSPWRQPRFDPPASHDSYLDRLDSRPPILGGRSHKDQLGSVAEWWGDDGLGKRYGQFTIEDDPPSRSGSPFLEGIEDGGIGEDAGEASGQMTDETKEAQEKEISRITTMETARNEALERARRGTRYEDGEACGEGDEKWEKTAARTEAPASRSQQALAALAGVHIGEAEDDGW